MKNTFLDTNILTVNKAVLQFYGWWQFGVCLFAFAALLSIWYHLGRKQQDFGQVWLALSVLCWSISGAIEVFFSLDTFYLDGCRSILSLLNSLFILLALPYFKHLPQILELETLIKSKYWFFVIGLPFIISIIHTLNKLISVRTDGSISELDVYYAIIVALPFLGSVLWKSFTKRNLHALAYLSMICILTILAAQILKLFNAPINLLILSAIFKTNLIMIFFALALSWVKDISESIQIEAKNIFIKLERMKKETGKFEHILWVKGVLSNSEFKKVILSKTMFNLMLKFAKKKSLTDDPWLEIKPKSDDRQTKEYDIKDHNEIKRLISAILDGLFGKGIWSKTKHETPFRAAFLGMSEQRERKIQLKLPKNNIFIEEILKN